MTEVDDFAYLWADLARYALLRVRSGRLLVFDTIREHAILIEDDDEAERAVREMLRAGARVLGVDGAIERSE